MVKTNGHSIKPLGFMSVADFDGAELCMDAARVAWVRSAD